MKKYRLTFVFVSILIFFISTGETQEKNRDLQSEIQKILQEYPVQNAADLDIQSYKILQLGKEGILSICSLMVPSGEADDSRVRFALGGLTTYVSRTGNEKQRKLYAKSVSKALNLEGNKNVKAFLIRQLQRCGKKESVKPLKPYLSDPVLFEPAVQALLTIGSPEAETMLLRSVHALPQIQKVSIIRALGELKSQRSVKKIIKYSSTKDRTLRDVTLFALANIGDPLAEDVLNKFSITAGPYARAQAPSLYLLYAQRLAERGKNQLCVNICRDLIQSHMSPQESHVACSALETLVNVLEEKAFDDLLVAMDSSSKEFRIKALELSNRFQREGDTSRWIERMENSSPEVRAEIIRMLAIRGDTSVLPVIIAELKSEDLIVRLAAIPAVVNLGDHSVLEKLWPMLHSESIEEIEVLQLALLGYPTRLIAPHAARIINDVPPSARMALIEILAQRQAKEYADVVFNLAKTEDEALREAALNALERLSGEEDLPHLVEMLLESRENNEVVLLQNAIVAGANLIENIESRADQLLAVLETCETENQLRLLRILPRIGGTKALKTVIEKLENEDARVQSVAVYALAKWPDMAAMEDVRRVILTTENPTFRYVSLQGYVRLIQKAALTFEEQFSLLSEVFDAAVETADKKVVISGLSRIKSMPSLERTVSFLQDPELLANAAQAVTRIVFPEEGQEIGLAGPEVEAVLIHVAKSVENRDMINQIKDYLGVLWERDGFVSLFNGKDLSGWMGNISGYEADEGTLIVVPSKGGGNLYTEEQFSDFILRFEFRLTPGANNGLGIRAPLDGDAAYMGMELQILDNSAEKYKDLKPYQFHGSIYGVVPAKRGFLNPVGEWNMQEVTSRGNRITVKLNGTIIVDADITDAIENGTLDGREHPGLKRSKGHIGFLGHGSHVEFSRIWIKEQK
ncbi:DUF1080 domain-containing protein [Acidobacteriota bacterium]